MVLEAVGLDGCALQFAAHELRADPKAPGRATLRPRCPYGAMWYPVIFMVSPIISWFYL